ncbi:hypothetical protein [Undibacterium baiyunense]|uniref:Uncharacterized protein n=1 Tax=Undibacterium baiyunense TaxID=2828731 RepID=A0A941DAV1_9BURK|nr:hypothetical protein [Undibacterium baiyunense]MBR7745284.1 hypothetical protein [Undibacterium baiyunense]
MKLATVFLRKGKIYVQGYAETVTKLWVANGPVYVANFADSHAEIGAKINAALLNSVCNLSHPSQDQWKAIQAPMLEAVGVGTWATLAKGTKAVGIQEDGYIIALTPSSEYSKNGGKDLLDKIVRCNKNDENLGSSLLQALASCDV